jgi:DNA-binding MarR family transcriptional regulator
MAALATTAAFESSVGQAFSLRPAEFTMLALIAANPGISARRLAQAIAVTPPFITVGVDKLAARGLVTRSRSSTDKRSQRIEATASGLELARTSAARASEGEGRILDQLDDAERVQLLALLRKLAGGR